MRHLGHPDQMARMCMPATLVSIWHILWRVPFLDGERSPDGRGPKRGNVLADFLQMRHLGHPDQMADVVSASRPSICLMSLSGVSPHLIVSMHCMPYTLYYSYIGLKGYAIHCMGCPLGTVCHTPSLCLDVCAEGCRRDDIAMNVSSLHPSPDLVQMAKMAINTTL